MPNQTIVLVDAFASGPFTGNPAGVCLMERYPSDGRMQSIAIEMNQAETAFLVREKDGFRLRWFTPGGEVDLCGHATLASAHYLWETDELKSDSTATFYTLSGELRAKRQQEWIELNFPAEVVTPSTGPLGFEKILGATPVFIGRNRLDYLVELSSEEEVRNLSPDLSLVALLDARGLIVTAKGSGEADIVSRCFYPKLRVNEDPVTGSAHCGLAPYWKPRFAKKELLAFQASQRGGWLKICHEGERVILKGQAITTLKGELVC